MRLTLKPGTTTSIPIEVEGVRPDALAGKSRSEIEHTEIHLGNRQVPLAELFRVEGDLSDGVMEWDGDMSGVHWIGAKMARGTIRVSGNVGRHAGSEMSGGKLHVEGNASDWVGGEMHGGLIRVRGRAGHLVGAAYRGSRRGMTGGTILIHGGAGNEIGHTMRRGLLVVGEESGDLVGLNMIAGTILVLGHSGIRPGAGMRRGTIGLLGPQRPTLLPSFRRACQLQPTIVSVLARHLQPLDFPGAEALPGMKMELYNGDMIEGGRGEILVRSAHP